MALRIEDYALIGDTHSAALVGRDGSIDWWCAPRFDSAACFAALLGDESNGRWSIAPAGRPMSSRRKYRDATLIVETEWDTADGQVRLIDHMPIRDEHPRIVRIVEGISGRVTMDMDLVIRFDYGGAVPWVREIDGGIWAIAGPDALALRTPVDLEGRGLTTGATFEVSKGDRIPFTLVWHPSHLPVPRATKPERDLRATTDWWTRWCAISETAPGRWYEAVQRSLITLKALTFAPTGGIVAAPTTSLPEQIGGVRNWDYRYCWLRDATFTLYALLMAGYVDEARAWRDWLLRAVAGRPKEFQILYGPAGERRLIESELPWLAGYEDSRPVRVGNAAAQQFQLDVFGEVMDALNVGRRLGLPADPEAWDFQQALMDELESVWDQPDEGIWEVRGPRRNFVHSKVMAWVAADRAVQTVEAGFDGPVDRWRRLRDQIHSEVCAKGFNTDIGAFTQYYGGTELDASVLMIPQVGFLPIDDARVAGTVRAIEDNLSRDGLVARYSTSESTSVDGLPAGEGVFLPCSFWLADAWAMAGRRDDAEALLDRLVGLANDVGLLAEEYDPVARRLVGNFPQAFSHLSLINTARNLSPEVESSATHRSRR
ncbi:MAG: glycoside hydrolase family 15 protein [Acidimicrobiales bacterium]